MLSTVAVLPLLIGCFHASVDAKAAKHQSTTTAPESASTAGSEHHSTAGAHHKNNGEHVVAVHKKNENGTEYVLMYFDIVAHEGANCEQACLRIHGAKCDKKAKMSHADVLKRIEGLGLQCQDKKEKSDHSHPYVVVSPFDKEFGHCIVAQTPEEHQNCDAKPTHNYARRICRCVQHATLSNKHH